MSKSVPVNTRVYAIGDVHGMADKLTALLAKIAADAQGYVGEKVLLGIGDYIDRGLDSKGVVNQFIQGLDGFRTIALLGNHDAMMNDFLSGRDDQTIRDWLYMHGGAAALGSYGVRAAATRKMPELRAELQAAMPAAHTAFFAGLQPYAVLGDYLFVHAGVKPNVVLEKQPLAEMIFTRPPAWKNHGLPYRIVFGHTIFEQPLVEDERIGIDTGAYTGAPLTCVVLEGSNVRFLQA